MQLEESITIAIILFFEPEYLDMSLNYIQEDYLKDKDDFSQFNIILVLFVVFLAGLLKIIIQNKKYS